MSGFDRLAQKTALIKAPSQVVDGKRTGDMTTVATVNILPPSPASSDVIRRMALDTPTKLLITYFQADTSLEVKEGYIMEIDGQEYPIKPSNRWPFNGRVTYEVVLEDLKDR